MSFELVESPRRIVSDTCLEKVVHSCEGDTFILLFKATVTHKASALNGPAMVFSSRVSILDAVGEAHIDDSEIDQLVLRIPTNMIGKITLINSSINRLSILPDNLMEKTRVHIDYFEDQCALSIHLNIENDGTFNRRILSPTLPSSLDN